MLRHRPGRTTILPAALAAFALFGPQLAWAQQVDGLYIGAGVGYSILQDQSTSTTPAANPATGGKARFDGGFAGVGSIGYGVGNGLRLELEGGYRDNTQTLSALGHGDERKYGGMANLLFDVDAGLGWVVPYLGLGGGYQEVRWGRVTLGGTVAGAPATVRVGESVGRLAYQAIVGASFPIALVPGLSLTAEYRYLGLAGDRTYRATAVTATGASTTARVHTGDDSNHEILVGLRYAFDAGDALATPARPPLALPPEAVPPTRTYLIFFDWDRADLTPHARDLVAEAVRNSARVAHTMIEVSGYADRSGTAAYNQTLSLHRAQNVAAEMQRGGVPANTIDVHAYGDTRPLVPTAAGVREPQNRRVEIVYR